MKTAKILIIGDEILSGRTQDTNSNYLAKALSIRGIRVLKIEVIPDDLILISQWVHQNHGLADYIFICGGIGGTPDDVTRSAVARGVGVELQRNPTAEKLLKEYYKERANEDRMSMSDLPEGCELITNNVTKAPGFKIKNIYVFAGIPQILHDMFENIKNELEGEPLFEEELNLKVGEGDIAKFMKQINKEFPLVELGSYPSLSSDKKGYKTQLVFRAPDSKLVSLAVKRFQALAEKII
jgi:molybdenum cofactor synthesis domain-containing protein